MKKSALSVIGLLAMLISSQTVSAEEKKPESPQATALVQAEAEAKNPVVEKTKIVCERSAKKPLGLQYTGATKSMEIDSFLCSGGGLNITIVWKEGKKTLFSFKGKAYTLDLTDEQGDGRLEQVSFTFKDSEDRDNQCLIKRSFQAPLASPLKEKIEQWFGLSLDYIIDGGKTPGYHLLEEFDLQAFYEEYIKSLLLERLK